MLQLCNFCCCFGQKPHNDIGTGMNCIKSLWYEENTETWHYRLIFFCLHVLKMHFIGWTPSRTLKANSHSRFPISNQCWSPTVGPEPHHTRPQLLPPSQHPSTTPCAQWSIPKVTGISSLGSLDNTNMLKTSKWQHFIFLKQKPRPYKTPELGSKPILHLGEGQHNNIKSNNYI